MNPIEKLAYLKGLVEGLGLDEGQKYTRVIYNLIELLEELVFSQAKLEGNVKDIQDQVDAVDEDLGEIEKDLYEDGSGHGDHSHSDKPKGKNGKNGKNGDLYYEVTCPTCGDTICLDDDIIGEGEIDCPNCGEKLEFDLDS
ncbi:MAG: hypothetical protein FWE86_01145 [Oscillospiraceae bacterium]|nr:hypothetical protein [Oscillospiraceae bacterium]